MKTIMTMFRLTEQEREFIKEMGRGSLSNGLRYLLRKAGCKE